MTRARGRPRDPAVDEAILRAALELFLDNGWDATSIEAVAKRAGVTRLTVYRRFAAKEELLSAAIDLSRGNADAQGVAGLIVDPSSRQATTEALIEVWVDLLTRTRFVVLLARLIGSAPDHPELLRAYWHKHLLPRREQGKVAMRAMRAGGWLPAQGDDDVLLDVLAGAVTYRVLVHPVPPTPDELRAYLRQVLVTVGAAP